MSKPYFLAAPLGRTLSGDFSLAPVNAFVDALAELDAREWLALGSRLVSAPAPPARSASWAIVSAIIAEHRLGVLAWHVRDGIDTAAFLIARRVTKPSRLQRRHMAAAHGAAEEAATAVLVHELLPEIDFDVLYAPFANLITTDRPRR